MPGTRDIMMSKSCCNYYVNVSNVNEAIRCKIILGRGIEFSDTLVVL